MENGSLYLEAVISTDAANYSCIAKNDYGEDVITYSLSVQGIFPNLFVYFFNFIKLVCSILHICQHFILI